LVVACKSDSTEETGDVGLSGPSLFHEAPTDSLSDGDSITLAVEASDNDGVAGVELLYRVLGAEYYTITPVFEQSSGLYEVELTSEDIESPGFEYYFRGTDLGEIEAVSYLPVEGANSPFSISISPRGVPLPFTENFEGDSLFSLDWVNVANGFAGYPWELTPSNPHGGEMSVWHARGYDGMSEMDDILISPALDFSDESEPQVTWYHRGAAISDAAANLWVSTGARDPAEGDYQLVEEVQFPESDQWERSSVVNLGEWGGEPVVYLAWEYIGANSGDWFIDDVSVSALTCDLAADFSWSPDPVLAGDTVTLTFNINNAVESSCADLEATLSLPEGAGELTEEVVQVGEIVESGAATVEFDLDISSDWKENTIMPFELAISGPDGEWVSQHELVVGWLSEGRLSVTTYDQGLVQVSLGVGDPELPDFEELVYASTEPAGTVALAVDITDQVDLLPPEAGTSRWYARVFTDSTATVDLFEIDFGNMTYMAASGESVTGGVEKIIFLPEPPNLILWDVVTTPNQLQPGDQGVLVDTSILNDGARTEGPVFASLTSDDAGVTVDMGGPVSVGGGMSPVLPNTLQSLYEPFVVSISSQHVDSSDLDLILSLSDNIETWDQALSLSVPWPVLKVMGVEIDDADGGDGDGLLEPGEEAEITLEISNVGDLSAEGIVSATLTLGASTTATASVLSGEDTLGTMSEGRDRDAEFSVSVDSTSVLGDNVELSLLFDDNSYTYSSSVNIVLGERPWIALSTSQDDTGDHYESDFDLLNAYYRTDGSVIELMIESGEPYVSSTAFVEAWMVAGGGDYSYFRLVLQSGNANLQGYDSSGFNSIGSPSVDWVDSTHLVLTWPISDMGDVIGDAVDIGFGAGWCGVETDSFCDHFPNGWGYYYHSTYSPFGFFNIRW